MPWVEIQRSVHTKYKSTSNTDWNEIQRWWNSPREILEKWNPNPCRENWAKPSLTLESPHVGEALESPANPPRRWSTGGAAGEEPAADRWSCRRILEGIAEKIWPADATKLYPRRTRTTGEMKAGAGPEIGPANKIKEASGPSCEKMLMRQNESQ